MNKPLVIVLNSASVDGRLAVSRDALLLYGDTRWKSIEKTSETNIFKWLKFTYQPKAILEGSGSFARDDEQPPPLPPYTDDPTSLYQDFLPERIIQRVEHRGWFTAVDGRGRIRWTYKEFPDEEWKGWYPLVLVAHKTPPEYLAYLQHEEIPYLVAGKEQVDLARAFEKMRSNLGVNCILSTAGGRLNGALLRAGLVDEINIEFLPGIIGGFDTPSLFDSPELQANEMPTQLRLISAQVEKEGQVWLRYQIIRGD